MEEGRRGPQERDSPTKTEERWPFLRSTPARSWERGKISRVDRECFGLLSQEAQSIPQIV